MAANRTSVINLSSAQRKTLDILGWCPNISYGKLPVAFVSLQASKKPNSDIKFDLIFDQILIQCCYTAERWPLFVIKLIIFFYWILIFGI